MTESKARKVELFDTSLRDGLQQPNLEISVPNAVMLLQRMGAFGVRYAEIGFAGANQFVADLTGALDSVDTGAMKLALFGRTRGRGAKVQEWPDVKFIVATKSASLSRSWWSNPGCSILRSLWKPRRKKTCSWFRRPFSVCRTTALKSSSTLNTPWTPPAAGAKTAIHATPI